MCVRCTQSTHPSGSSSHFPFPLTGSWEDSEVEKGLREPLVQAGPRRQQLSLQTHTVVLRSGGSIVGAHGRPVPDHPRSERKGRHVARGNSPGPVAFRGKLNLTPPSPNTLGLELQEKVSVTDRVHSLAAYQKQSQLPSLTPNKPHSHTDSCSHKERLGHRVAD